MRSLAVAACLLLVLVGTACAAQEPVEVPPPTQARELALDGRWKVTAQQVTSGLRHDLGDDQEFRVEHYRVPVELSWKAVVDHYAQALGEEWAREESIAVEGRNHRRAVWTNGGWAGDPVLAVALIDDPVPGTQPSFHVLLVATSPG